MKHAGLVLLAIAAAVAATPTPAAPKVVDASFVFIQGGTVTESNKVPLLPGEVCFEWRLRLDVFDALVKYTEVFILPAAPEIWETNPEAESDISADGLVSTTSNVDKLVDGWLRHGWCVAEGDPLGDYRMEISIEGTLVHTFEFKLIEPGTLYL